MKEIKERARTLVDNLSLRRYLKGWDCIDKTQTLSSTLEQNSELKLYISKLCNAKGKYLLVRDSMPEQEQLVVDRMTFIYDLISFFMIYAICMFRFAHEMSAFEVYEVKQSIEDVVDYLATAEKTFENRLEIDKAKIKKREMLISQNFMEVLTFLHIQKSSNPDADKNEILYHSYKALHDVAPAELVKLGWSKDKEVFLPFQNFVADLVQKRYLQKAILTVAKDQPANDEKTEKDQEKTQASKESFKEKSIINIVPDENKNQESKSTGKSELSKTNSEKLSEPKLNPKSDNKIELTRKSSGKKENKDGTNLTTNPLKEAKLSDSLGPLPPSLKKKKSKRHSRTFAPVK